MQAYGGRTAIVGDAKRHSTRDLLARLRAWLTRSRGDRVLIVRLGALGDIVHAIPVAAALRRAFRRARIDWLVSARTGDPRSRAGDRPRLAIDDRADAPARMFAAIRELRRTRYDVALDLQGLIKSAFLARSAGPGA